MRRLMFFAGGVLCGVMIGATVALLAAPASGEAMRSEAKDRLDDVMSEARRASEQRRRELEAQLAQLTSPAPSETAVKPV
jgi:gas vesicle protein